MTQLVLNQAVKITYKKSHKSGVGRKRSVVYVARGNKLNKE